MSKKKDTSPNGKPFLWPVEGSFDIADDEPDDSYDPGNVLADSMDIIDEYPVAKPDTKSKEESMNAALRKSLEDISVIRSEIQKLLDVPIVSSTPWADEATVHYSRADDSPRFDNENVVVALTLFDNDFSNILLSFAERLAPEMTCDAIKDLTDDQKQNYFREVWNRTCLTLHYFSTINGYHIAKQGDDLFDPSGYGTPEAKQEYMTNKFVIKFGEAAQDLFQMYGSDGNGEFVFIDNKGNCGYS